MGKRAKHKPKQTQAAGRVSERTARTIIALVQYIAVSRWMASAYGSAKTGKSFVLQAVEGEVILGRPIVLRVGPGRHTIQTFARRLCAACNVAYAGALYKRMDRIVEHLTATRQTLVIDDCDALTAPICEFVRELWDGANCPVLFMGNRDVCRIEGLSEQFVTRIAMRVPLAKLDDGASWLTDAQAVRRLLFINQLRFVSSEGTETR